MKILKTNSHTAENGAEILTPSNNTRSNEHDAHEGASLAVIDGAHITGTCGTNTDLKDYTLTIDNPAADDSITEKSGVNAFGVVTVLNTILMLVDSDPVSVENVEEHET